ncbi:MAG: sigma-70 family RNA polymerase sigma factor [Saprospiraceae bacterium]|nr:sigma-70 family RNA polymerase sigma factor [Saprospiraceae bacterium]
MFVLCLRYANSREDAEDLLQEGFIMVFRDLHQYKGVGNLEGWVRKVILNIALQYIRRQKHLFQVVELEDVAHRLQSEDDFIEEDTTRNLIRIMQQLPPGFRTVLICMYWKIIRTSKLPKNWAFRWVLPSRNSTALKNNENMIEKKPNRVK